MALSNAKMLNYAERFLRDGDFRLQSDHCVSKVVGLLGDYFE